MVEDIFKALEWFDLERYEAFVSQLNYEQWLYVLDKRSRFWEFDVEISPHGLSEIHYKNQMKFKEYESECYFAFIHGLINGAEYDFQKINSEMDDFLDDMATPVEVVGLPYLHILADNHRIDGMNSQEYLSEISKNNPKYVMVNDCMQIVPFKMNDGTNLLVNIDLSARDDVIFNGFKNILIQTRQEKNITPSKYLTDNDIKKFVNLRLLQYIDLVIFCRAKNLDVNNVVLSKLLYPDEYETNPVDRIRKTIPEVARNAMDYGFLQVSEYWSSLR